MYKGRTIQSLGDQSGIGSKTLTRYVHTRLNENPPQLQLPIPSYSPQYLIIDGLWFGRLFCLMVYRLCKWPLVIHFSITKKEWGYHIAKDLEHLKNQGYVFQGFVSDGGTGITKAIDRVFPHAPHQRCLVHIHREASKGVGKKPQEYHLIKLKQLVDHLFLIESREALRWWTEEVLIWTRVNHDYLQEITHDSTHHRWWYTHRKVRRTVKILLAAPNQSFVFTKGHPLIPRTTNEVEGLNSILKSKWRIHQGLSKHRWVSFLKWFIYFRNLYYLSQLKTYRD